MHKDNRIHMIKDVRIDLRMSHKEHAATIQQKMEHAFTSALPKIDKVFTQNSMYSSDLLIIEKLELDLGILHPAELDEEISLRITELIRQKFSKESALINNVLMPNDEDIVHSSKTSIHQRLIDSLLYFLVKGYLPWWTSELRETEVLNTLDQKPKILARLTHHLSSDPRSCARWTRQFSPSFLNQFILLLQKQEQPSSISSSLDSWLGNLQKRIGNTDSQTHLRQEILTFQMRAILTTEKQKIRPLLEEIIVWLTDNKQAIIQHTNMTQKDLATDFKVDRAPFSSILNQAEGDSEHVADPAYEKEVIDRSSMLQTLPPDADMKKGQAHHLYDDKGEGIYIDNAGLIILHPFLDHAFQQLKYLSPEKKFQHPSFREQAVGFLQYMVTAESVFPEYSLPLCKILCGMPLGAPIAKDFLFTKAEMREAHELLTSVIQYWPALKKISPEALQETFLQREGKLMPKEDGFLLKVQHKSLDILMTKLNWSIGFIQHPWMESPLIVDWI